MTCPICGKELQLISHESLSILNHMNCEENYRCDCGYYYEVAYGAEREMYKERHINKWNIRLFRLIYKIKNIRRR